MSGEAKPGACPGETWTSTSHLTPEEIAYARAADKLRVNKAGMGYVPSEWLTGWRQRSSEALAPPRTVERCECGWWWPSRKAYPTGRCPWCARAVPEGARFGSDICFHGGIEGTCPTCEAQRTNEAEPLPDAAGQWPTTRKRMTRAAYEALVAEDLAWLDQQPSTLESRHIRAIVQVSIEGFYGDHRPEPAQPLAKPCDHQGAEGELGALWAILLLAREVVKADGASLVDALTALRLSVEAFEQELGDVKVDAEHPPRGAAR